MTPKGQFHVWAFGAYWRMLKGEQDMKVRFTKALLLSRRPVPQRIYDNFRKTRRRINTLNREWEAIPLKRRPSKADHFRSLAAVIEANLGVKVPLRAWELDRLAGLEDLLMLEDVA